MRIRILAATSFAGLVLLTAGCSDDNGIQTGTLRVRMTDAPAAIEQVNLVIEEVSVHRSSLADTSNGWETLPATAGTFDLMKLRNGVFTTLASAPIPAGRYDQIRLRLGAGSTVVADGVSHPLVVPSGLTSGLKLNGDFEVPAGTTVDVLLDFDAARSIHVTGSGTYMLKPVVRVLKSIEAGTIRGSVPPGCAPATIYVISGADTVASTVTDSNGDFAVSVLPAGDYSVGIDSPTCRDSTMASISVGAGSTTDVGQVELEHP